MRMCYWLLSSGCLLWYAEVQQWLVDRASGEGGLWGGLHPQSSQTGEHPFAAGAEDETEPTQLQVTLWKNFCIYSVNGTNKNPTLENRSNLIHTSPTRQSKMS